MSSPIARLGAALADRYSMERELGAGGMATVFLARDLRHQRQVAIKVLKPELAAIVGAERFLNEIRVTANLQHPHILALHDSGDADGLLFYVMPFLQGESLRERLRRERQLAIEDAVAIGRAVASALDYAHRNGVIHRDIKPENILLHDGQPLVADFGIALAVRQASGSRLTGTGLSIGTPQYMSPEQAMGDREIDARSDIYSLGAVMYEMLVGDPPYAGLTAQAIVAKVITEKPVALSTHRDTVPGHVAAAIHKALSKLPADRFASAAQFSAALGEPGEGSPGQLTGVVRRSASRPIRLAVSGALLALGAAVAWGWLRPRPMPVQPVVRFVLTPPEDARLNVAVGGVAVAVSPDGNTLVFVGHGPSGTRLHSRRFQETMIRPIEGTEGGMRPFFSPNGAWIGFVGPSGMQKVPVTGGPPITITRLEADDISGADWGEDGRIIYSARDILYTVSSEGGVPAAIRVTDSTGGPAPSTPGYRWPEFLPGGRTALVTEFPSLLDARIGVLDLTTGRVKVILDQGTNPHYVAPGFLVYGHAGQSLMAVRFDPREGDVTGDPVPLLDRVNVRIGGAVMFTISAAGTAVYLPSGAGDVGVLALVDRSGGETLLSAPGRQFSNPRYSPDGRRIVAGGFEQGGTDLFVLDARSGAASRLTFRGSARRPSWSPDGRSVAFWSSGASGEEIAMVPSDGSGPIRTLFTSARGALSPLDWSPDGLAVLFAERGPGARPALFTVGVRTDTVTVPSRFLQDAQDGAFSPDGRWVVYASTESGREEILVSSFPRAEDKWQISHGGGSEPVWSADGRRIYYRARGMLIEAAVTTMPSFSVQRSDTLLSDLTFVRSFYTNYDVHPDGTRFVMVKAGAGAESMTVVVNWVEELKSRFPR